MKISILTVFPELYDQLLTTSLIKRAVENGTITINLVKFSQMCAPKERIDEGIAGHGAGMIIKPEVIEKAIASCEETYGPGHKLFFSPQGTVLNQQMLRRLAHTLTPETEQAKAAVEATTARPHLILICTRYEGIDQRILQHYDHELVSIGDYVVMGGDLPAQVFLEGFLRMIPGVVGNSYSVEDDSFSGALLDYPQYGQTKQWHGMPVPDVLKSGNHGAVAQWRMEQAAKNTVLHRWDWLREHNPTKAELAAARTNIPNHYSALMHTEVLHKGGMIGTSSVASLDIHDIARSGSTYGIERYFIVTPLLDQTELVNTFLSFWKSEEGKDYNASRFNAVSRVQTIDSLDAVIEQITAKEGKRPLLIATRAKKSDNVAKLIDFHDQGIIWQQQRPILFIFGTAHGLAPSVIDRCDYLLMPVTGMTDYNHLSVRSAAAIIFDRWLGLNPRKDVDLI